MKYHEVSFKQSHNSYERKEDPHVTLTFHSQDPGNAGCRGLEYDIWRHSDATGGKSVGYFTVAHTIPGGRRLPPTWDTSCRGTSPSRSMMSFS